MADTLRSLAGDKVFKQRDIIDAFQPAVAPADVILNQYVFLPYARTGIAAALNAPFAWTLPNRATIVMRVPVIDERGGIDADMDVRVYGPADVAEIDPRQVIRTLPKADTVNAQIDDLVHVEFDRPDLPWLFTPAGPDAQGRLVPWITLVVAERRHIDWGERRGAVRRARIRRDQLQPLGDAWAWAHAQVIGPKRPDPTTPPTLEQRLGESNAPQNLSRLVCPRRLAPHTAYVACVVPTFLAGAQAGLGITPATTLAPAWGTANDFAGGDPFDMVALPVYFSWNFGTAEEGNFESLARKLRPAVAPPGVGRRRVDATQPWQPAPLDAGDPGAEMVVTGPVVSPQPPVNGPPESWPTEAEQHWDPDVTEALATEINRPDEHAHVPNPGPPVVGPPLYGGTHAKHPRIEMQEPELSAQPPWLRELNLDPRYRIVAGLGTRVVQQDQEDLMVAAWNQLAGLAAANRALRLAQMARYVNASLHRRHLKRFTDAALVAVTERVHTKVLDVPTRSVWASIERSSLPASVTAGAFRRLARVRGPIVSAAIRAGAHHVRDVDPLTVLGDRFTKSWVLTYQAPDGIHGLSTVAAGAITDQLAQRLEPGTDRDTLLTTWRQALAKKSGPDYLTPEALSHADVQGQVDLGFALTSSLADRVIGSFPDERDMEREPQEALTGAAHAPLLQVLVETARAAGRREVPILRTDAKRLRLSPNGRPSEDGARILVDGEELLALGGRAIALARRHDVEVPFDDFNYGAARLRDAIAPSLQLDGRVLVGALESMAAKIVLSDAFADPGRDRIHAPTLGLTAKLDPALTVPARISGRLRGGTGRLPGWLRNDWFGDGRIEPVMAHPRFRYPMYEPLHRYDPEWMVPGLGLIPRPDMATLLQTNNSFIEAYLIGLNHEMARELLWREFPTDQRGTYFSSFWTGAPELVSDLHEAPWRAGRVGEHMTLADGQVVFLVRGDLVRRYPGVVAHAAPQLGIDALGVPYFGAADPVRTLFHIHLPPNVLLVGFAMTRAQIDEKWWFTLSENPTEPRFGLDPSRAEADPSRDNLIWADFGVNAPGQFLDATQHTAITFDQSQWGASSASIAYLLFQLPARAAFKGTTMVTQTVP
jgi:hypothetical protein